MDALDGVGLCDVTRRLLHRQLTVQGQRHLRSVPAETRVIGELADQKWVRLATNATNPGIFQIRFSTFWLLDPKWVRLAPNGTNPEIFQIRFSTFWLG